MSYIEAMKPWMWLLIFAGTVGASIYLWKKAPSPGPLPVEVNAPMVDPTGSQSLRIESNPNLLPKPVIKEGSKLPVPRTGTPENTPPEVNPLVPPNEFQNQAPIPPPQNFYPPPSDQDPDLGYPGYVPAPGNYPPGSMPPEEGEPGLSPPAFEPPPPLDEEFIPPPPPEPPGE